LTKSDLLGSAVCVLLAVSGIAYSRPSTQETKQKPVAASQPSPEPPSQEQAQKPGAPASVTVSKPPGTSASPVAESSAPTHSDEEAPKPTVTEEPAQPYTATAYCLRGVTSSGRLAGKGLIAADPSVLPLGTRVRVEAGPFSGEYLVADTGGAVRGHRIDIWTPNMSEAVRFGKRAVKLTVLSYGPRKVTAAAKPKGVSKTATTPKVTTAAAFPHPKP